MGKSLSELIRLFEVSSFCPHDFIRGRSETKKGKKMTKRKFLNYTLGGYWVRNIEIRECHVPFVLQAEIGNHTDQPPSDDPLDWSTETFTENGKNRFNSYRSPFDLVEVTQ